ncbi:hypothetical protein L2E82_39750 [Cichorium intybus]|uniref:Uncharacterized protein n=1 Tax=Cichorium intybus TaxID=13427 RepID=A0ACB9AJE6_CICIN|nr:hypothetical protein L2E82_39750 [Cichorium intybus]
MCLYDMSKFKDKRPPQLATSTPQQHSYDDAALDGVAANVKLLLKLIQDHRDACKTHRNDGRRMLRVAGMMTILDMVRTRIQNCQSFGTKQSDGLGSAGPFGHSPAQSPKDKQRSTDMLTIDEKGKLKRELSASSASRKSLEVMCSSLGKEKEIMLRELAKKAHELSEMEEHINDLKAQNETLLGKVLQCAEMHKHDENKEVLKSLDEYRLMKRKVMEVHEENMAMQATMEEMGTKVSASLYKIRNYRQHLKNDSDEIVDIEEGILELEHMLKCFEKNSSKTAHS